MRQLTINESEIVCGAESHDIMIIDPVAAMQTAFYLMSVVDQGGFRYGSVVTGMGIGALGGSVAGYAAGVGSGLAAGIALGAGGFAAGAVVGGVTCRIGAEFLIASYNMIMG